MRIRNGRTGALLAEDCRLATYPPARALGLMGRSSLPPGEALLIRPCSSVHSFFMRFPIDVVFLDREGVVLKVYAPLRPWRASTWVRGARQALEMPAGTLARTGTSVGDTLALEE